MLLSKAKPCVVYRFRTKDWQGATADRPGRGMLVRTYLGNNSTTGYLLGQAASTVLLRMHHYEVAALVAILPRMRVLVYSWDVVSAHAKAMSSIEQMARHPGNGLGWPGSAAWERTVSTN
jgi:hypothetical protein